MAFMDNTLKRNLRAAAVAAVAATVVAIFFSLLAGARLDSAAILDWFGTPLIKLSKLIAGSNRDIANDYDRFLIAIGFPLLSFINYWIFFFGILVAWPPCRLLLDRAWPLYPDFLDHRLVRVGAKEIDAFHADAVYVGRVDEMAQIETWLDKDHRSLRWGVVAGKMGMGKTRICLEVLKRKRNEGWDAGLLSDSIAEHILAGHRFRRPTVILIDDYEKWGRSFWQALSAIARNPANVPLVVLITDHVIPIVPLRLAEDERRELIATHLGAIELAALDPTSARQINPDFRGDDARPLLLKLGKNPWGELTRRAAERLDLATESAGADGARLLAAAALAGPLDGALARTLAPGLTQLSRISSIFEGAKAAELKMAIPAVRPEMLGHEILLQWLQDRTDAEIATLSSVIEAYPDRALRTYLAMIRERPALSTDAETGDARAVALDHLVRINPDLWKTAAIARASAYLDNRHAQVSVNDRYGDASALIRMFPGVTELRLAMINAIAGLIHAHARWQPIAHKTAGIADWGETAKLFSWFAIANVNQPELLPDEGRASACIGAHFFEYDKTLKKGDIPDLSILKLLVERGRTRLATIDCPTEYLEGLMAVCVNTVLIFGRAANESSSSDVAQHAWDMVDQVIDLMETCLTMPGVSPLSVRRGMTTASNVLIECADTIGAQTTLVQICPLLDRSQVAISHLIERYLADPLLPEIAALAAKGISSSLPITYRAIQLGVPQIPSGLGLRQLIDQMDLLLSRQMPETDIELMSAATLHHFMQLNSTDDRTLPWSDPHAAARPRTIVERVAMPETIGPSGPISKDEREGKIWTAAMRGLGYFLVLSPTALKRPLICSAVQTILTSLRRLVSSEEASLNTVAEISGYVQILATIAGDLAFKHEAVVAPALAVECLEILCQSAKRFPDHPEISEHAWKSLFYAESRFRDLALPEIHAWTRKALKALALILKGNLKFQEELEQSIPSYTALAQQRQVRAQLGLH